MASAAEHQRTALKSRTIASHTAPEWGNLLLGAAIILLATLAVYWPAVHAGFVWDDDDILTANPVISAPDGLRLIWAGGKFYDYWPVTLTSFWCEWRLWGLDATGYHVTNILLHAAAAILFWRVLRHLRIPAAWLAAMAVVAVLAPLTWAQCGIYKDEETL